MNHPGPPRFAAVGDELELAPRDPDPEATYRWSVAAAPEGSRATVGSAAVTTFVPDVPGRYRIRLTDPQTTHTLTIRAFPATYRPPSGEGWSGDARDTSVPGPNDGGPTAPYPDSSPPEGGGRPRLRLDADVADETVVVRAQPNPHPDDPRDPGAFAAEFVLDDRDALSLDDPSVTLDGHDLRIDRAALDPGRQRVHAVAVGESYSVPDAVTLDVGADGSVAVERPNDPPAWGLDATVYEVYVRSFADPDEGQSRLADVTERLAYLDDLGGHPTGAVIRAGGAVLGRALSSWNLGW